MIIIDGPSMNMVPLCPLSLVPFLWALLWGISFGPHGARAAVLQVPRVLYSEVQVCKSTICLLHVWKKNGSNSLDGSNGVEKTAKTAEKLKNRLFHKNRFFDSFKLNIGGLGVPGGMAWTMQTDSLELWRDLVLHGMGEVDFHVLPK